MFNPRKRLCFDSEMFLRTYLDHEGLVNMTRTIKPEEFEEVSLSHICEGNISEKSSLFKELISSQFDRYFS